MGNSQSPGRRRIGALLRRNKLVDTLVSLTGNAKWCVWTEPMWGVPFYLYSPLMSKYMQALGLTSVQIGVVATVYIISQMVFAFFAGAVTDRLGRRWTTTLVDIFCWCVPFLLWMNARGFAWFVVAAAVNGLWRITENSFGLLLAEDAPEGQLVNIYSLVTIAGLLAGFFSPLTSLLVARHTLVPVMRGIFVFCFAVFTTKLVILHVNTHETETGLQRMAELRGKPFFHSARGSVKVIHGMLSRKPLMLVLGMMACVMVVRGALESFLPLHLTGALGMPPEALPLLSGLKSVGMLACFFLIAPRLRPRAFFRPMAAALSLMAALCLLLFALPASARALVYAEVLLEALALSMLIPLFSSLQMLLLDRAERARMYGFSLSFCLLITSPFGAVNGLLSRLNTALPMLLAAVVSLLALFLLDRLKKTALPEPLE